MRRLKRALLAGFLLLPHPAAADSLAEWIDPISEAWLDQASAHLVRLAPSCRLPAPARFYEAHGENYALSLGGSSALIIGRAAWGARPPLPEGRSWTAYPADRPFCAMMQRITVHHTHSLYTIRSLQEFHQTQVDPKADIGYHFFIDRDGQIYEGRPLGIMGSHSEGDNSQNVGIVLNGDFDTSAPGQAQLDALRRLLSALRCPCAPLDGIWTHQQRKGLRYPADPAHYTACPGVWLASEVNAMAHQLGLGPLLQNQTGKN